MAHGIDIRSQMEKLMNNSIFNKFDCGSGRDVTHKERFRTFEVTKVETLIDEGKFSSYRAKQEEIKGRHSSPIEDFQIDTWANWMRGSLNRGVNECYLFHGTSEANARSIMASGFDIGRAKHNPFGRGIYFAENADKADQYCGYDKTMLLVLVTLGRPYIVYKTIDEWRPDGRFDSVVAASKRKFRKAALHRHQEFVVYDSRQCYPKFLIHYKRRK